MADTERVIIVNPEQQARQQLVEDMKRLKANPIDRTIPGGYFIGADGKPHDANGEPVKERSESSIKAEVAKAAEADAPAVETEPKKSTRKR